MTYQECIKKYIDEGYIGHNNTCNGRCIKCGECCGNVLPLDQEDADRIQEYVIKHNIFPQRQILVMCNKLQCPYYTGNINGCAIYEARPKICRYYKCDERPQDNIDNLKKLKNAVTVDMWAFALAIEREMKKNGINEKTRKTADKSI